MRRGTAIVEKTTPGRKACFRAMVGADWQSHPLRVRRWGTKPGLHHQADGGAICGMGWVRNVVRDQRGDDAPENLQLWLLDLIVDPRELNTDLYFDGVMYATMYAGFIACGLDWQEHPDALAGGFHLRPPRP
jgi:hypothetical protein